ncbi:lebercilin isoform X2 [Strongylocentrotus purpuratus]|uniref:Lebercilin domain-containing protein n=1 Tax=Strongylocentrotus purpuratus TaxID=7668 RepID=A0A7M7PFB7_STRPU|nr:lebercilin isoform X2 [Strongylocentrotus purpuratus]
MSSNHVNDSFFDSDGDQDKEEPFTLKGEYHRSVTPPSHSSNSPHNDKPDSGNRTAGKTSQGHSRSSTSGNFTADSDTMSSHKRDSSGSYHDRSRSRTPDYSDSFDSEDSMQDSRRGSPVRNRKSTRRSAASTSTSRYNSGTSKDSRSTYRSYGRATKPSVKKAPKKKGVGRSQSVTAAQQSPRSTEVTRRMLSAKGHTINKLRSDFDDLRRKYDDAIRENKLMKQLQRRQEASLAKFEDKDEELPQLLRSHAAEVDNLRERLRRTQDREKDKDRRLKDKNEELNRLNDELKKLRHLADNKHLLDRDKLQRKVDRLQDNFDEKERRVNELEKHVENMKKNVRHDSEQWKQREREYRARVAYLEEENQTTKFQLKEKEKELDIRNIYSHRVMKPPAKLNNTLNSTPRPLAQTRATSNDDIKNTKPAPTIKRSSSAEENRKTDHTPRPPKPEVKPEVKPEEKKVTPRIEEKKQLSEHDKILLDLDGGFKPLPPPAKKDDDILNDLDNEIKKRERLDEEKMRSEQRMKREKEEQQRKRQADEEEWRRRLKQEEEETKRKEEEEQRKGQLSFFSGPKNPYKSSRSKAKSSAYEPYFPSNNKSTSSTSVSNSFNGTDSYKPSFANSSFKAPFSNSPKETESDEPSFLPSTTTRSPRRGEDAKEEGGGVGRLGRREEKKPFWLTKDNEQDRPERARDISAERERKQKEEERKREEEDLAAQRKKQKEESERLAEERRKKDILLAKMRDLDTKPASGGTKKDYKFTQPIENLHNGKPSHPDLQGSPNSTPKKKPAADTDAVFGSYAPTFGRRAAAGDKPPVKKGGLFDDDDDDDSDDIFATPKPKPTDKSKDRRSNFFSDNKSTTPNKGRNSFEGSVFSQSTKAKPVADNATLPWEKKTQPQGNLFGQANKPNGLTVNLPKSSFDDFDDDIEEVML